MEPLVSFFGVPFELLGDTMNHDRLTDWKTKLISYGLFILFAMKFGKFLVLEIWDVIGPLFK